MGDGGCFAQKPEVSQDWSTTPEAPVRSNLDRQSAHSQNSPPTASQGDRTISPQRSDFSKHWMERDPVFRRAKAAAVQAKSSDRGKAIVQRHESGTADSSTGIGPIATRGFQGIGQPLPHLDKIENIPDGMPDPPSLKATLWSLRT